MSDLREAAEMALEAWDWDWSEPRNEALRERMEALRQALAQPEQEPVAIVNEGMGGIEWLIKPLPDDTPLYATPVDVVNMSQERVDETAKREHEPVAWFIQYEHRHEFLWRKPNELEQKTALEIKPLYTAPPALAQPEQEREWVGYTNEDRERIVPVLVQSLLNHDEKTMAMLLKAILIDIELQLKEKNT